MFARKIENLIKAQLEFDKANNDCDSSWGYYGQDYQDSLEKAEQEVENYLIELIKTIIKESAE